MTKDHILLMQQVDRLSVKIDTKVEKQDSKIDSLRSDMVLHFTNHLGEFNALEKKVKKFGILMLIAVGVGVILNKVELLIPIVTKLITGF